MGTTYEVEGLTTQWANGTGVAVSSDDVVVVGRYGLGIASVDIAASSTGTVAVSGVHTLAKYNSGNALTQGQPVWWNSSTSKIYNAPAAGYYFIGYAEVAAGATATTCKVRLAPFALDSADRIITLAATGNQSLTAADFLTGNARVIVYAPNTAAHELALPAVASIAVGARVYVQKTTADAFAVTLNPNASEQIGGGATYAGIDAGGDRAEFYNSGTAWVAYTPTTSIS